MTRGQAEFDLPSDTRAESAVLNYALIYPEQILSLGLSPDQFWDVRHRQLWAALCGLVLEAPASRDTGHFYLSVIDRLASDEPTDVRAILASVDPMSDWLAERWAPESSLRQIAAVSERIRQCADARKIIDAAQQIAERAARVPYEPFDIRDASVVLTKVAGVPDHQEEIGMVLPI